jgi:hypothetical protein
MRSTTCTFAAFTSGIAWINPELLVLASTHDGPIAVKLHVPGYSARITQEFRLKGKGHPLGVVVTFRDHRSHRRCGEPGWITAAEIRRRGASRPELIVSGCDRARRICDPFAPRAAVNPRGFEACVNHRQLVDRCRNAGPALMHDQIGIDF